MEHMKHILAIDEIIEAMDDEIELAEEHLDRALEFSHNPELAHEFIACAEEKHARAEKFRQFAQKHVDGMKARGEHEHPHHKMACDLWCVKHPELCADLDELKFSIQSHKQRMGGAGRGY